jgi:hypothetical protein
MYFFFQIVLFATALAATSDRGTVVDLTCRPPRAIGAAPGSRETEDAGRE